MHFTAKNNLQNALHLHIASCTHTSTAGQDAWLKRLHLIALTFMHRAYIHACTAIEVTVTNALSALYENFSAHSCVVLDLCAFAEKVKEYKNSLPKYIWFQLDSKTITKSGWTRVGSFFF